MRPTATLHEVNVMKFEATYGKYKNGWLTCEEAAEILGLSVSTFYRMRQKWESQGVEGLVDKRIGKISSRRVPVDTTMKIINLFETKYYDFTVKHFHEKLAGEGFNYSYTFVKNLLQTSGIVKRAKKRGQHRRKRERKPFPGMMIHQDGSRHQWVKGKMWDLIVTMDDATSEIYSMFFCDEEGTWSAFQGLSETIKAKGLPCSLYVDRGSHYFITPQSGGKVDKTRLTQVGRAMEKLGIEMIAAYSPEARGRSERMFGTLQRRLPQELRLRGIDNMEEANMFLMQYKGEHNAKFAKAVNEEETAFTPLLGVNVDEILCVQEARRVNNDNTVQYKKFTIQILQDPTRVSYAKTTVHVHEHQNGTISVFYGPKRLQTKILRGESKESEDYAYAI